MTLFPLLAIHLTITHLEELQSSNRNQKGRRVDPCSSMQNMGPGYKIGRVVQRTTGGKHHRAYRSTITWYTFGVEVARRSHRGFRSRTWRRFSRVLSAGGTPTSRVPERTNITSSSHPLIASHFDSNHGRILKLKGADSLDADWSQPRWRSRHAGSVRSRLTAGHALKLARARLAPEVRWNFLRNHQISLELSMKSCIFSSRVSGTQLGRQSMSSRAGRGRGSLRWTIRGGRGAC